MDYRVPASRSLPADNKLTIKMEFSSIPRINTEGDSFRDHVTVTDDAPLAPMDIMDDVIETSSSDENQQEQQEELSRRDILSHFIQSTVAALGGYVNTAENGRVYEMGDSCLGCLRDLKKFWRKDDNDPERTVARIFWETRVLPNDLVPILLETAGKGLVMDKRAIACGTLI